MPNSNLGLDFLNRSLRTTGGVLLIGLPFGIYYLGFYPTLAVFSGGVWGVVNILFLSKVIRGAVRPDGVEVQPLVLALLVKFPLLYLAGYALLKVPQFSPLNLTIGFSTCLAVILLKALARMILGLDNATDNKQKVIEVS